MTTTPKVGDHQITVMSNVRTSPKWSFGGRHAGRFDGSAPGPGQYQPGVDGKFHNSSKYGFGTSERKHGGTANVPGPGTYEAKLRGDSPAFSCTPRRVGPHSRFNTPGPGTYVPGINGKAEPKWGFGSGTRNAQSAPGTPGPGTYNGDKDHSSPKWGMGTGLRQPLSSSKHVPGPGTYELPGVLTNGPKYSVRGRKDAKNLNNVPGPGQYAASKHIGAEGPSYGFGLKTGGAFNGTGNPGPGAYQPGHSTRPQSPNWGFGSGGRDGMKSSTAPGPGQYNPDDPNMVSARWGFGSSKRGGFGSRSVVPGPGTYQPTTNVKGIAAPQYSLTPRRPMADRSFTPGPGAYQPGNGVHDKPPEWAFSRGERSGMGTGGGVPGPGSYNANSSLSGPKYTMRAKSASKSNNPNQSIGATITQFGY